MPAVGTIIIALSVSWVNPNVYLVNIIRSVSYDKVVSHDRLVLQCSITIVAGVVWHRNMSIEAFP